MQTNTYTFSRTQLVIAAIIVVVAIGGLLIWKSIDSASIKKEYTKRMALQNDQAVKQVKRMDNGFLHLIAKPYVWAVREQMMKGNISEIGLYGNDIVKGQKITSVFIVNPKGIIVSATNKRYEGAPLAEVGQAYFLTTDSTVVENRNDSVLVMASPIMSFNSRIGTLVVHYAASALPVLEK